MEFLLTLLLGVILLTGMLLLARMIINSDSSSSHNTSRHRGPKTKRRTNVFSSRSKMPAILLLLLPTLLTSQSYGHGDIPVEIHDESVTWQDTTIGVCFIIEDYEIPIINFAPCKRIAIAANSENYWIVGDEFNNHILQNDTLIVIQQYLVPDNYHPEGLEFLNFLPDGTLRYTVNPEAYYDWKAIPPEQVHQFYRKQ